MSTSQEREPLQAKLASGDADAPSPHIGILVKMFPRLSETFILNEILELEAHRVPLHICSLKRPVELAENRRGPCVSAPVTYLPDRIWHEPIRVLGANLAVFLRYPRSYWRTLRHVVKGREYASLRKRLRRFCQTCCAIHELNDVQHLHAHFATDPTRLATWAQMISNISFSVTTHAKDLYQADRISSTYLRQKLSRARFVVANSEHSSRLLRTALGSDSPPVYTIYNGIDLDAFPMRQTDPGDPLILSVGRLVEKKGFSDLLHACQILHQRGVNFRCEIIGSGDLESVLKELIVKYGLTQKVTLLGSMPHTKVRAHYAKAMAFALPCVVGVDGDRDILPNVLKEAMAAGVPVITTSMSAIDELITHEETGLLVPTGAVKALAGALELLLADPVARRRMAVRARKVIEERFDRRKNFVQLKDLLLQATQERASV